MKEYIENKNGIYRDIVISENVSDSSMKTIIEKICEINYDDNIKEECFKDFKRLPINLYVSSFGGSVYDGFALMDIMKNSKTKIKTIAIGKVMSMGLPIFLCGHEREIKEYTTFMYHEIQSFILGKTEEVKQEQKEMDRLQNIIDSLILKNTKITNDKLSDIKMRKQNGILAQKSPLNMK